MIRIPTEALQLMWTRSQSRLPTLRTSTLRKISIPRMPNSPKLKRRKRTFGGARNDVELARNIFELASLMHLHGTAPQPRGSRTFMPETALRLPQHASSAFLRCPPPLYPDMRFAVSTASFCSVHRDPSILALCSLNARADVGPHSFLQCSGAPWRVRVISSTELYGPRSAHGQGA